MSFIANILVETPSATVLHHIETSQRTCTANLLTDFYMTQVSTKGASAHSLVKELFSSVFRVGWYCLIMKISDILLFTLVLLKPFWSILNSFSDTKGWPGCKVCCNMCDFLSLPACSNTLSLIILADFQVKLFWHACLMTLSIFSLFHLYRWKSKYKHMSCSTYNFAVSVSFNGSMILFINQFAFFFQLINYPFWV